MKNIYMKLVNLEGDGWHSGGGGVVPLDFYAMIMMTTAVQLDPLGPTHLDRGLAFQSDTFSVPNLSEEGNGKVVEK